jgi:hypothetical protein
MAVPKAALVKVFEKQKQNWRGNSSKATTPAATVKANMAVKKQLR